MDVSSKVTIAAPAGDIGENRYLTHFTSEIFFGGESAGYLMFTRYDYRSAKAHNIPIRWMIKPFSYMSSAQNLLINKESRGINLPLCVDEMIEDHHGAVVIIDEITCRPGFSEAEIKLKSISLLVEYLKKKSDGVLINEPRPFAYYLSGIYTCPIDFWGQFGFHPVDQDVFLCCDGSMTSSSIEQTLI